MAAGLPQANANAGLGCTCGSFTVAGGASLLVGEGQLSSKGRAVASRSKIGRGPTTVPIFLLVPQVRLPKRVDLACDAERALDGVPGRIVAKWVEGFVTKPTASSR
jgi:hypothetical protein